MPNDIPDWTQATNITAGSVTIAGGSVAISGTPTVNINAGQSVAISGTPSVSISGTPTVILGAGVASVGSISGISGTVTVAGSVNIGNTPSVSISGTPTVTIAAGTAAIGTVTLGAGAALIGSVSGTVNIGNTPAVTISGTPSVSIASGSVTISSGTINIQTVAATSVQITPQVQSLLTKSASFQYQLDQAQHVLVAGVGGQTIKLYQVVLAVHRPKRRSFVRIVSTDLAVLLQFSGDTVELQVVDYHGLAFPVGIGLAFIADSQGDRGGVEFSITLQYTQQ